MPLLEPELVEPAAPTPVPSSTDETQPQRFDRLYTLMNELVSDYLGLRGYFMQLKIEKCSSAEELLALQNELGAALAKSHGKEVATELMAPHRSSRALAVPICSGPISGPTPSCCSQQTGSLVASSCVCRIDLMQPNFVQPLLR